MQSQLVSSKRDAGFEEAMDSTCGKTPPKLSKLNLHACSEADIKSDLEINSTNKDIIGLSEL